MRYRGWIDEAIKLDLPNVVEMKTKLFRKRLLLKRKRRQGCTTTNDDEVSLEELFPKIYSTDLIFVFEGELVYLKKEIPTSLLQLYSKVLLSND